MEPAINDSEWSSFVLQRYSEYCLKLSLIVLSITANGSYWPSLFSIFGSFSLPEYKYLLQIKIMCQTLRVNFILNQIYQVSEYAAITANLLNWLCIKWQFPNAMTESKQRFNITALSTNSRCFGFTSITITARFE